MDNKVVVVVGADTAVGSAVAREFERENARVSLVPLQPDGAAPAGAGNGRHVIPLRGRDWDEPARVMKEIRDRHGRIDVTVFTPRPFAPKSFLALSEEEWEENEYAVVRLGLRFIQETARHREAGGEQRIILVLPAHTLMAFQGSSAQSSTCAALETIARVAAVDLGPHNIKVNCVVYGWTHAQRHMMYEIPPEKAHLVRDGIPLGRCADPSEIAGVVKFLAGPQASYVTGATVRADGGYLITRSAGQAFPEL